MFISLLSNFLVSGTNDLFKDYNLVYISRGIWYVSETPLPKALLCMRYRHAVNNTDVDNQVFIFDLNFFKMFSRQ